MILTKHFWFSILISNILMDYLFQRAENGKTWLFSRFSFCTSVKVGILLGRSKTLFILLKYFPWQEGNSKTGQSPLQTRQKYVTHFLRASICGKTSNFCKLSWPISHSWKWQIIAIFLILILFYCKVGKPSGVKNHENYC